MVVTMLFPASKPFNIIGDPWLTEFREVSLVGIVSKQLLQISKKLSHKNNRCCKSMHSSEFFTEILNVFSYEVEICLGPEINESLT